VVLSTPPAAPRGCDADSQQAMSAQVASAPPAPWRGRPPGSWREEEAARERLRAHRRHLKNARPTIVVSYRAPLPRRPVLLPGLPVPENGSKARKARKRRRARKESAGQQRARAMGRRVFVPLLQPIDETASGPPGAGAAPLPSPGVHHGPAPPAYRPSPELVAAIVQFQTEELEEGLGRLRVRRTALAEKRKREEEMAAQAVVQAETWDASTEVCMAMVRGLQDGFRSSMDQLLQLQHRFIASRAGAADPRQPTTGRTTVATAVPVATAGAAAATPRSSRPHHQAAQPHRRARMSRLLRMRREEAARRKKRHLEMAEKNCQIADQAQPEWDDAVSDLAALRVSKEAQAQRKRLLVSKHAQHAKREMERKLGALSMPPLSNTSTGRNGGDTVGHTQPGGDATTVADLASLKRDKPTGTRGAIPMHEGDAEWDGAISDLHSMRFSEKERERRRALLVSRHAQQAKQELRRKRSKDSLKALAALASEEERRQSELEAKKSKGRAAVSSMMQQLRDKQRAKREQAAREAKAIQFLAVIMGENLRLCFSAWLDLTRFNRHISRLYFRFVQRAAAAAFESWVVLLAMGRASRARIGRAVAWWMQMQLAAAYHGWRQRTVLSRNAKLLLTKVTARWRRLQLASLVAAWIRFSFTSRAVRLLTVRVIAQHRQDQLEGVWNAWGSHTLQAGKARALLVRVMARWQQMLISSVFMDWHDNAVQQKQTRVILARLRAREMLAGMMIRKKQAAWAWNGWARAALTARKARALTMRVRVRTRRECASLCMRAWADWAAWQAEVRRQAVADAVAAETNEMLAAIVEEEAGLVVAAEHATWLDATTAAVALEAEELVAAVVEEDVELIAGRADEEQARLVAEQAARLAAEEEATRVAAEKAMAAAAAAAVAAAQAMQQERSSQAAVRVQAVWRGLRARQHAAMMLDWWDLVIEEDAATRIQAMWRGRAHRARITMQTLVEAAVEQQHDRPRTSATLSQQEEQEEEEEEGSVSSSVYWDALVEEDAAVRIQAAWRGLSDRSRGSRPPPPLLLRVADSAMAAAAGGGVRPGSAASIQSFVSDISVSSSVEWQDFVENHAVTCIQAWVRGWRGRRALHSFLSG
jgi:hypothetical protein